MRIITLIGIVLMVAGCKKSPPTPPKTPDKYENGIVVLNEGLFEQNNASISFYDGKEVFQQVFKSVNNRGLGDTANDFEGFSIIGQDYIIMAIDISSQVEIVNRYTMETVAQIPLFDGINAREPRHVVTTGSTAYVCNFDGTVAVIDLYTMSLVKLIEVGANPDGMVIVDNELFVSNSGGLNYPVYDSTLSIIDLETNELIETFETRINSTEMLVDNEGDIYLRSNGNYDDIEPALLRIKASTHEILAVEERSVSAMNLIGDWIYFYNGETQSIERYNTVSETFENVSIIDCSEFETFHGMQINEEKGEVLCLDANGYVVSSTVRAYTMNGDYLYEFQAGLNATDILFNK